MQSGTLYVWGKGSHERPRPDDFQQCSTPYPLFEQKQITYLSFGKDHMLAIDRFKQLYGWGEGNLGCLGFGDGRKKMMPIIIPFFEGKQIIDFDCGDNFSVVIAEVYGDPMHREQRTISADVLQSSTARNKSTMTNHGENRHDTRVKS